MPRALKAFEGWTTIAVFAAPCLLVALDQFVGLDPTPPVEENRYLAKAPTIIEIVSKQMESASFTINTTSWKPSSVYVKVGSLSLEVGLLGISESKIQVYSSALRD